MTKDNKIILFSGWILATIFVTIGATLLAKAENEYDREAEQLRFKTRNLESDLKSTKQELDYFKIEYFKLKNQGKK